MKCLFFFIFLLSSNLFFGQKFADSQFYLIDSLIIEELEPEELHLVDKNLKLYHKAKNEIQKILFLANITENSNDIRIWPKYNNIIIARCQDLLNKKNSAKERNTLLNLLCEALNDKGFEINEIGEQNQAVNYFVQAIAIAKELKDEVKLLNCYNNLGNTYLVQGNIPLALKYSFLSLKIAEKVNDLEGISIAYGNLGVIYDLQNDYEKAKEFYYKGLKIQKKIGDKSGIATCYNNLGFIYHKMDDNKQSIYYYSLANSIYREIKEYDGISASYSNIGSVYVFENDIPNALLFFDKSIKIDLAINNKKGLSHTYTSLARIYKIKKEFVIAEGFAIKAYKIAKEIGASETLKTSAEILYKIYAYQKKWEKAFEMQELYFLMKDSLNNLSNQKESITLALNYDFEKQKSLTKKENEKKLAIAKEKQKKQQFIIFFGILGFIIVSVFSYFIYKRYKVSQVQNIKIKEQKEIIEEKQKEINDSINYAERIQKSFLAAEDVFTSKLSDYFIFFKPKDVVSGDFYWAYQMENKFHLCVADSTGHGIPGAFMSLLNISLLNEALLSKEIKEPNSLLDFVRKILILGLKADETGQGGNDGMDCACITIDFDTLKLYYAGANNPLWIVRNNELIELKADKMPVGRSPKQDIDFSLREFQLEKNDSLYLFSDGYPDQFGGPKGKKFKYKAFSELILQNIESSMTKQGEILENSFNSWKGDLEQVDDVCVIGLKI